MPKRKINRLESFQSAFSGIWHTIKTERNAQIHIVMAFVVLVFGLILRITLIEWAVIILAMGFVLVAETFNTAIEVAMDYISTDFSPEIKIIKDVAAGAVLISAITAFLVGLLILGPPLLGLILVR